MTQTIYGVDLNWPRDYYFADLKRILDRDFPGWRPANQVEDFNGQTLHIVIGSVAFETPEDLTRFMIQHALDFNATVAKELRFDILMF